MLKNKLYKKHIINVWLGLLIWKGYYFKNEKIMFLLLKKLKRKNLVKWPINLLEKITNDIKIVLELQNKKVSGKILHVPKYVKEKWQNNLGVKFLMFTIREKINHKLDDNLYNEVISILNGEGKVLWKKLEIYEDALYCKTYLMYF